MNPLDAVLDGIKESMLEQSAYIRNAREHLGELSSMIHDYLTNKSDLYIKAELLQEISVIDGILEKL